METSDFLGPTTSFVACVARRAEFVSLVEVVFNFLIPSNEISVGVTR